MLTYTDIEQVCKEMKTILLERYDKKKGITIKTEYPMVVEKIKAFKKLCPNGTIETELVEDDGDSCIFKAIVRDADCILGIGHAQESKDGSFINKTSYIENCETSAVGRALSFAGFGGDGSIASAEEVANAIKMQNMIDKQTAQGIMAKAKKDGVSIQMVCERYGVKNVWDLTKEQGEDVMENWSKEILPNCKQKE